ncbi:restriction endonuclease subunit S [Ureaplasma parvum]
MNIITRDNYYYEKLLNLNYIKLGKISYIYTGNSINSKIKELHFTNVDGINYIATKDINYDKTINYDNGTNISSNFINKFRIAPIDSILLCIEGGSAGKKIGFLDRSVCFGNKLCCLNLYFGYNKFLFYYLQSPQFISKFEEYKTGIIGGLSIKKLEEFLIPLISMKSQKEIATKLELIDRYIKELC